MLQQQQQEYMQQEHVEKTTNYDDSKFKNLSAQIEQMQQQE